ncbi:hypothetical protein INT47_008594 [Mucor saturninus]|uniref:Uncharacterized protein n=1 Tax=Mucor saturninus TaxID=64648 RepID=A0A8H7RA62_9FUNG|nr:hypothetical protein INT47_008594 [Mucor saturninus]
MQAQESPHRQVTTRIVSPCWFLEGGPQQDVGGGILGNGTASNSNVGGFVQQLPVIDEIEDAEDIGDAGSAGGAGNFGGIGNTGAAGNMGMIDIFFPPQQLGFTSCLGAIGRKMSIFIFFFMATEKVNN